MNSPLVFQKVPEVPALSRLVLWRPDVARLLGVCKRTLSRMVSNGDIPAQDVNIRGRRGWKVQTIQAWQEAGCPKAA